VYGSTSRPRRALPAGLALAGCLAFAAALALPRLGARPLYCAGEVRNALIAEAMVESGDWVQPRLNGARYYEKPPLMYWAMAAAYEALGATELASRLPAALAYVGTAGLVFAIAAELLGTGGAIAAALVFATAAAPYHFARFVSLDTVTTMALTLSFYGLALVTRADRPAGPRPTRATAIGGAVAFWLGAALAAMTKGLLGFVLPLLTAGVYAATVGGPRTAAALRAGIGGLVIAVVWLPWHAALAWRDAAFLPFYLLNEHVYRFLNMREPIDYAPLSLPGFWLATLLWFFPWALLVPGAVAVAWRDWRRLAVPALGALMVIGFFTAVRSRLEYYGQPAYPALAVLIAAWWQDAARRGRRRGMAVASAAMLLGGIAAVWLVWWHPEAHSDITALVATADGYYREYFQKHPDRSFFFGMEALRIGRPFALWLIALGAGALIALRLRRPWWALACWIACLTPALAVFDRGLLLLVDDRAQRAAAELVTARWQPGDTLAIVGTYEDAAGLTFYSRLPTLMVDGADGDMLFGFRQGDVPDRFLDRAAFDTLWHSSRRVYAMAQIEKAPADGTVLLEAPRHRLMVNHP
jgi:4-amino-4-deoxy-L-arabinose transferase-like glycosyltransferase